MNELILGLLLLFVLVVLFVSIGYILILTTKTAQPRQQLQKKIQTEQYNNEQEHEILLALINEQFNQINDKIIKLYELVGKSTKFEILEEIKAIKNYIKQLDRNADLIKTQHDQKKQEIKSQIAQFLQFADRIKSLLELDQENLLAQREQLKKLLRNQELEYQHMIETYTREIQKLQQLIDELKLRYPEDLITKLNVRIAKKTEMLDTLKAEYESLKKTTEEKLKFLDEILMKKSTEIEQFINSLQQEKEQELSQLKDEIDLLKQEVVKLDEAIKNVVNAIHLEQKTKGELIERMKKELENLQTQEFEINNLKLREEYLSNEIAHLNTEYEQLKREYNELSAKKTNEIKQLQAYSEAAIQKITSEWEKTKESYLQQIRQLKKRIDTLKKRMQRLVEIQKKTADKYQDEQKKLETELHKKKLELQRTSRIMWEEITKRINRLEVIHSQLRQKVETIKLNLFEKIRTYDDKILELKQRSKIREDRIQRNIEKCRQEYLKTIAALTAETEQLDSQTKILLKNISSQEKQMQIQLESKKEQLETYIQQLNDIVEKVEIARQQTERFEEEINKRQQQMFAKFDEILESITLEKTQLISKLEDLLRLEESGIVIKPLEKSIEKL